MFLKRLINEELEKIGYDKKLNTDLLFRLKGSLYNTAKSSRTYLYGGDRAGSRYYFVMENTLATSSANYSSGLITPGFTNELTAIMINPFVKYKGLEFFGMVEKVSGKTWENLVSETIKEKVNAVIHFSWPNKINLNQPYGHWVENNKLVALSPEVDYNLALGSYYISDLDDLFGSQYLAFAAYNAGPNRVEKWIKTHGDPRKKQIDAIDFIELIPFHETRNYVQRVSENINVYEYLKDPANATNKIEKILYR